MIAASLDLRGKNKGLRKACSAELEKDSGICGTQMGPLALLCLRGFKSTEPLSLSASCRSAIRDEQVASAIDVTLDPMVSSSCSAELEDEGVCGKEPPATGARLACLKKHKPELSKDCRATVFRRQQDDAGDLATSLPTLQKCSSEMKEFCPTAVAGEGDVAQCLWKYRRKPGFSQPCAEEISLRMQQSSTDSRLNFKIMSYCKDDIQELCPLDAAADREENGGTTIECLKSNYAVLQKPACRGAVRTTVRKHAVNFFMNADIHKHCSADALLLCCSSKDDICGDVTSGEMIQQCLKTKYDDLSEPCQHEVLVETQVEAQSIEMKPQMQAACAGVIGGKCKDKDAGAAEVIECLQDHRGDHATSDACRAELAIDAELTSKDFRLKYGIATECEADMSALCGPELIEVSAKSPVHGGSVLSCLVKKRQEIDSRKCNNEVKRHQVSERVRSKGEKKEGGREREKKGNNNSAPKEQNEACLLVASCLRSAFS